MDTSSPMVGCARSLSIPCTRIRLFQTTDSVRDLLGSVESVGTLIGTESD